MPTKFRPLADRVLVLPDVIAPTKVGGLAVPTSQKEKPTTGGVVAAGPKAKRYDKRTEHPMDRGGLQLSTINQDGVGIGERVQFAKHSGRPVKHDGVDHLLLRLEEIDGVLEDY